jgi:Aldehyde dehydrogenase family
MDQDVETRLANLRRAPRCEAITRAGTPCQRPALRGRKRRSALWACRTDRRRCQGFGRGRVSSRPDLHDYRAHPGAEQDRRGVVKPGMRAFDEEIFGPVAAITSIGSDDEAVELANHNEYGLSAGVFSADVGRAIAVGNRLNTGLLHINDQTVADEPHVPFGGSGASGNGTRIGGPANWDEFTQWQWMTIKDKPNPYPF